MEDKKADLIRSLAVLHEGALDKLAGLGEYDLRRPLTGTGSNLLGIVKHLATVQAGYFGETFGRPWPAPMPWTEEDAEINADMFATADESSEEILDLFRDTWAHANETFAVTASTDTGTVPWWPEEVRHPTLLRVLTHMTVETARHVGHLDILRELIDGAAGRYRGDQSVPGDEEIDWPGYVGRVEAAAKTAAARGETT
ncbi:MAG: DinB family protein [Actinomycetota bacterium]